MMEENVCGRRLKLGTDKPSAEMLGVRATIGRSFLDADAGEPTPWCEAVRQRHSPGGFRIHGVDRIAGDLAPCQSCGGPKFDLFTERKLKRGRSLWIEVSSWLYASPWVGLFK